MAEFQEVAKHWKRMCKKYWKSTTCHGCPIAENKKAYEACSDYNIDVCKMEELVMAWAAEHPEPVYPTWGEWFAEQGELSANWKDLRVVSCSGKFSAGIIGLFYNEIPADIAQKLGIEPKEG